VLALAAIVATLITSDPLWDAIGTLSIGVLLLVVAWFIAVEIKALLIGQSVDPVVLKQMRQFLEQQPQVKQIFNLLTLEFGPDTMVAVKAYMQPQVTDHELVRVINLVEASFRARFPSVRWLFFEPDDKD